MTYQPLPEVFVTGSIPDSFTLPKGSPEAQRLALATAMVGNAVLMSGAHVDTGPYIQGLLALSDWSNLPLKEFDQSLHDSPAAKRQAMHTTLKDLESAIGRDDWEHWMPLMFSLGKFNPSQRLDDEPVTLSHILKHTNLRFTLKAMSTVKGHDRTIRLFAAQCLRQVEHRLTDLRSKAALDAVEGHTNGLVSADELAVAKDAAAQAVADLKQAHGSRWWTQREQAVVALATAEAPLDVARIAEGAATYAEDLAAQEAELRRVLECVYNGIDPYPIIGG